MKLLAEAVRSIRSQPAFTALVVLVAAAVCVAVQLTAGEGVVAQGRALDAVDRIGARIIDVRSTEAPAVPVDAVGRISRVEGVEWIIGLGRAFDVAAPRPDRPAPALDLVGTSPYLRLSPGEGAFLSPTSADRLGLDAAVGAVMTGDGAEYAIGGVFDAAPPLAELDRFVLIRDPTGTDLVDRLVVAVGRSELVPAVVDAIRPVIGDADPGAVTVQAPVALLEARMAIGHEVGRFGRGVVLLVLGAGVAIVGVVTGASLVSRRRDFGRRRALGASRSQLVGLVLAQVTVPAAFGAVAGTAIGGARLQQTTGAWGDLRFEVAVAVLTVLAVAVAALPPAVAAARRDPVAVLRTP